MEKAKRVFLLKQAIIGFFAGILWGVAMIFLVNRERFIYYLISGAIGFSFCCYFLGFFAWKYNQNKETQGNNK